MNEPVDSLGRRLDDCGCCVGVASSTPGLVYNRPGLPVVAYRVGTHTEFKESMLAGLTSAGLPALADLKTRDDRDFAIALIDAWATTADVLTFYQERLANESFLRTANERESLIELARLIGYRLKPGVAANAYLAFTVDEPVAAAADAGRAMESTPGPTGRANIDIGLKVQSVPGPDEKPQIFETVEEIEARAEWNAMRPQQSKGATLDVGATTIWMQGADLGLEAVDWIVGIGTYNGSLHAVPRRIRTVSPDPQAGRTRLDLEGPVRVEPLTGTHKQGFWAMRVTAAPFGHNAGKKPTYNGNTIEDPADWEDWPLDGKNTKILPLDGTYDVADDSLVVIDRRKNIKDSDKLIEAVEIGVGELASPRMLIVSEAVSVRDTSLARYGISGRVTELTLDENWKFKTDSWLWRIRDAVVLAGAKRLHPAENPIASVVTGPTVILDSNVEGLVKGQRLAVTGLGDTTGERISEVVTLQRTEVTGADRTKLFLKPPLAEKYRRDTVAINGNVALATHGETAVEILGSGNATAAYQEFELKQSPLTHVTSSSAGGAESTLQIRVNDVRWKEEETLYDRDAEERIFVTRIAEDGTTTVQFGDGTTGSRLPTGQLNLHAAYRKGIGTEAMVDARQLSQLMTRPLGVKDVINPLAAEGAEDPQTIANARRNAPLTVRTLERVVSLLDYEDFARNFTGVDKALATWTWDGRANHIHLTVAGAKGAVIPTGGATHSALADSLKRHGDPHVSFDVVPYRPVSFTIAGSILADPDHLPNKVLAASVAALRSAFSFEERDFTQPVMRSEIIAVLHEVAGVIAVDLDAFNRVGLLPPVDPWLEATGPQPGPDGEMLGAELLTLTPVPLDQLVVTS